MGGGGKVFSIQPQALCLPRWPVMAASVMHLCNTLLLYTEVMQCADTLMHCCYALSPLYYVMKCCFVLCYVVQLLIMYYLYTI